MSLKVVNDHKMHILKSRAGGGQNLGKESTFEKSELCL